MISNKANRRLCIMITAVVVLFVIASLAQDLEKKRDRAIMNAEWVRVTGVARHISHSEIGFGCTEDVELVIEEGRALDLPPNLIPKNTKAENTFPPGEYFLVIEGSGRIFDRTVRMILQRPPGVTKLQTRAG